MTAGKACKGRRARGVKKREEEEGRMCMAGECVRRGRRAFKESL